MANSSHLEFLDVLLREADTYQNVDPNLAALLRNAESRLRTPTLEVWVATEFDTSEESVNNVARWLTITGKRFMAPGAFPEVAKMLLSMYAELKLCRQAKEPICETWWQ